MPWGATPVWLWVPPDVILSVITIFWGILILFLYYRKYQVIWLWLIPMIACHIGAGYYFSFRWDDYATFNRGYRIEECTTKASSDFIYTDSGSAGKNKTASYKVGLRCPLA